MKLISEYNKVLLNMVGLQKFDTSKKYRVASFAYITTIDNKTFLYNNAIKRLYLLNKEEINAIRNLDTVDIEVLRPFIEDWSLVSFDFDDLQFINQIAWFYENFNRKYERPNFVIFTTTKCNARCYYCFEHGQRRIDMTEQTANDVADYIIKNAPRKEVYIKWFGGEPLYNQKAMDIICDRLKEAGVKYDTKATTNGYLFDEDTIKKAKEKWKLHSTVITLDGTEEVYNKTKNYIYEGVNPFRKVLNNIQMLLDNDIRVAIRLNIGFENFEDIKRLVIYLKDRFGDNSILSIMPIALYDLEGTRTTEEHNKLNSMVKEIEEMISKNKYRKLTLKMHSDLGTRCMAELDSCKVITPVGGLGTCEHFSEGDMIYGSIYSTFEKTEIKNYFKQRVVLEDCKSCVFYANCGGVGKCPTQTKNCEKFERDLKFKILDNCILATYELYLDNGEKTVID